MKILSKIIEIDLIFFYIKIVYLCENARMIFEILVNGRNINAKFHFGVISERLPLKY